MRADERRWHFWMDTGGTFTDCLALDPGGGWQRAKVLSSGVVRTRVTARPGSRAIALAELEPRFGRGLSGFRIDHPPNGTWASIVSGFGAPFVASLDRDVDWEVGARVDVTTGEEAPVFAMRLLTGTSAHDALPPSTLNLATTKATNAVLEGKGARVALFVTEGFGDLLHIGDQRRPDLFAVRVEKPPPHHHAVVEVRGRIAADGREITPLDLEAVRAAGERVRAAGCDVAAVALMHSYRYPAHEQALAAVLRSAGFEHVSVSSELSPIIKLLPRAETAVIDAMLAPVMERYLSDVASQIGAEHLRVMTSAGGLVSRRKYRPKDSLLSGPAGGVAGAAMVARRAGLSRVITFDMGGTSTDVARYEGEFDYRFDHAVGSARVLAPALRVESVAAGGGSICRFDGSALVVGPQSAGANPGPACYGAGGPLTLTDVNLLLGRIDPGKFALPVFPAAAEAALQGVRSEIAAARRSAPTREEVLQGFLDIANERMAEAIRRISVREGYDPADYALVAFGGAGGLHACAVAARLGMRRVVHPADSGLLSARGLQFARIERILERQILQPYEGVAADLPGVGDALERDGRAQLRAEGLADENVCLRRIEVELRFTGQDTGVAVHALPWSTLLDRYLEVYRRRFGYAPVDRAIEVVALRVVVSSTDIDPGSERFSEVRCEPARGEDGLLRGDLAPGECVHGPRLVQDPFSTLFVQPGWRASVGSHGSILVELTCQESEPAESRRSDVIQLELFTSRFCALVDDMGLLLQRCALSVNIKERLDFSCALLDPSGELVANAPHVPVHLGALGLCVRRVVEALPLAPGDVAITNHPAYGGAHLPDVTLIAPVHDGDGTLLGYVANRAHHAEIGGIRPGSMPPDARCLAEEGVVLAPMRLVHGGQADWSGVRARLLSGPWPSRRVEENIADLHAQLASIQLGLQGLVRLATLHGASCVHHYMARLKERAAESVAAALGRQPIRAGAEDAMDDGTPVVVRLEREGHRLRVDFSGSGPTHAGNLNATPAIVRSAVMYVLRLLAGRDLPLNEGLMRDVELVVPEGLLAPAFGSDAFAAPAVVGGNVETSQRVVDVLVRALGLAASSQGTMNNLIFGNARFSYYETIGGGTGAGNGFAGWDGVHSHMTNTAITDPEIMEARLPVRLERFCRRRGSGGAGRYRGGEGLERVIRFLEPVDISLLTQRRRSGPPGLAGGQLGQPGEQWLERCDGGRVPLAAIDGAEARAGDRLIIRTPGGGGWGG